MTRPSDEILMAYADDELPPEEAVAVERHLEKDPPARRLVLSYRLAAHLAREAYAKRDFEAAPARLLRLLGISTMLTPANGGGAKTFLAGPWLLPIAASLALIVLAAATTTVNRVEDGSARADLSLGPLPKESALSATLERQDGTHFAPAGGGAPGYVVTASVRDKFGNPCHEVDVFDGAKANVPSKVVVACRYAPSSWTVVGAVLPVVAARVAYVSTDEEAHRALAGVLGMIGGGQQASHQPGETIAP